MQVGWFEELLRRATISEDERAELYRRFATEVKSNALAKAKSFMEGLSDATVGFTTWQWTCRERPGGRVLWTRTATNLWTTVGCNYVWSNALQSATVYCVLIAGATVPTFAIGDTMGSHPGWSEISGANIVQVSRQQIVFGAPSGGVLSSSASPLSYQMASGLVGSLTLQGGAVTDSATLGGSTGNLISEAIFDQGAAVVAANNLIGITCSATLLAG